MREKNVPLYNKYDANKIMLCGICRIKWKEKKNTHSAIQTNDWARWREFKQQYRINDIIVHREETPSLQIIMNVFSVKHEFQSSIQWFFFYIFDHLYIFFYAIELNRSKHGVITLGWYH